MKTKNGIDLTKVEIGDIHYEYEAMIGIKCKVISKPVRDKDGVWSWQSENVKTNSIIDYATTEDFAHYGPNLYNYEAYKGIEYI